MNLALWTLGCVLAANPQASANLVLADAGKTDYLIVIDAKATQPERLAADDLAHYLHEISGADFAVRDAAEAPAAAKKILVGPGAAGDALTSEELAQLGQEGYVLRTRGSTLVIAGGRPRGTLYGIYSFLEDELGCRWFAPDVTRIVKRSKIELGALNDTLIPRLEYRALDFPTSRNSDWAYRNKINGTHPPLDEQHGGKIGYGPYVHTFNSILDSKEHFDKHPEYFSEIKGKRVGGRTQLCLTNPDVLRITIETVRKWMREQPHATIFSVSQNDWHNFCTCPECSKIAKEEGSQMGPYLRFVNAVADAVRDEFPDKIIDTLAYQFTRQPPTQTVPRPNVCVRLCSIECCFAHPFVEGSQPDPENAAFVRDLQGWSKLTKRLYIWDYVIDFRHSFVPFPNLYTLKPNINFFADHGVKGIYEEGNYFTPGGELGELRTWIMAKTLWDPSYDTDRAIDEFLACYYQEAAGAIRKYINLVHAKARSTGLHAHIFDGVNRSAVDNLLIEEATRLFAEAEKSVSDKPQVLDRVQVATLPIRYVQIARLEQQISDAGTMATDQDRQTLGSWIESFDAIAKKAGVTNIAEQYSYEKWLGYMRASAKRPTPDRSGEN